MSHHHHHKEPPPGITDASLRALYMHLIEYLDERFDKLDKELLKMNQEMTDLIAAVADENTVIDSVVVLLDGIEQQLKDLGDAPSKADLIALRTSVTQGKQKLADAVVRNTPTPPAAP